MKKGLGVAIGAGLGAGLMYLFDPDRGRGRRALLRDRVSHSARVGSDAMDATVDDVRNRARGWRARARALWDRSEPTDAVLAERVRAKLGRLVSHPGAVRVEAHAGEVRLRGSVLNHEAGALVRGVEHVRGVHRVQNDLDIYETAAGVASLQGGVERHPRGLLGSRSPAERLFIGLAGTGLTLYGIGWRGARRMLAGSAGIALLARAAGNGRWRRTAHGQAIEMQKTITLWASLEQVFDLWSHFENFPHFMSHVREVRPLEGGRSHWVIDGPGGMPIEWDAVITACEPGRLIAWKTEPGAVVHHAGSVHFTPRAGGGTQVQVRLAYRPPAGALGHAVAALLGVDPRARMNDDLMRMKSFVESGMPPHDAGGGARPAEYH